MKKLLLFSIITMIGITASAADITKEDYMAQRKAIAEKAGKVFNEKRNLADFEKQDLNKDGVLSDKEKADAKAAAKAAAEAKKAKETAE